MKKALKFTIETQTEENEIISICHLNERTIALELSDVARKMFRLNRSLFNKINSTTKLLGGKIYRHQIKQSIEDKNRCGVKILNKYTYDEVEILKLDFSDNTLQNKQTILTKNGKMISFDPNNLIDKGQTVGPLDPQNLTFDDVKNSTIVSKAEEIYLFQDSGIKSFMITDTLNDVDGLTNVAYRIQIEAEESFRDYVKFVSKELKESINFLLFYSNSIDSSLSYDSPNSSFKKDFVNSIFNQIGIKSGEEVVDLGRDQIKNSSFGKAALNYYNGSLLLNDVDKSSYKKILESLLPSSKTSPSKIKSTLFDMQNLLDNINKEYGLYSPLSKKGNLKSKVSNSKNSIKKFVSVSTEKISIDKEILGYNVFSENQTGLNKFTLSSYRQRIGEEKTKYYPSSNMSVGGNFMTAKEKSQFSDMSNAVSFVTPANLLVGKNKITCARGMNNIDINEIRQFRIAKSAKAAQSAYTKMPSGIGNQGLSKNLMSDFNITIGKSKRPLLERNADMDIDPLVDAKYYVGESSYFTTNNPEFIFKNFKTLMEREDSRILSIVSDAIPARFLRQNGSIDNLKDININDKKSKIRPLVSEKLINISDIPPQVKFMMTDDFQTNKEIDPLKNRESRAIIDETQKNIFLIKALIGFEKDEDGFFDLNRPIIVEMNSASAMQSPMLAKAYNYEIPELGILKDKFMPTIYNNLLYIRG
tara:strand:+ start:3475 stop:5577 length:2103 start_codon:yes stop_codon:yes gene_type:complete